MTPTAYPLAWPVGVPRRSASARSPARFNQRGGDGFAKQVSIAVARERLQNELDKLGRQVADSAVLSTNVPLTLTGAPRSGQADPADPAAAVYFTLKGKAIAMPCDRWNRVADNINALAKHIEAMRGMERWGVASIEQAFAGFAALPAPGAKRKWWDVFGIGPDASIDIINTRYRALSKDAANHPSGADKRQLELNLARDEALAERTVS